MSYLSNNANRYNQESNTNTEEVFMAVKNGVGRPPKMAMKIIDKLSDSISHNYNVVDSCKYAKISTSTFYYYLKTEPVFADKIATARQNQTKVSFNFRTL